MMVRTYDPNQRQNLEERLQHYYNKLHAYETELDKLAPGSEEAITLRLRIKNELMPELSRLETEYGAAPANAVMDEYLTGTISKNEAIAGILDHRKQLDEVKDLLAKNNVDRAVFWFEAHADDWPKYLAYHLLLDPWPKDLGCLKRVIGTRVPRGNGEKVLDVWCKSVLDSDKAADGEASLGTLLGWINAAPLSVFFVTITLRDDWRHLPKLILKAKTALEQLGALTPGKQLLVIFACCVSSRPPLLWSLYGRWRMHWCRHGWNIPKPHLLEKADIETWYNEFPTALSEHYNCGWLKSELISKVFTDNRKRVRFDEVRRFLVHGVAPASARS